MNGAYSVRFAFRPLLSSTGGFGTIAGCAEERLVENTVVAAPAREEVMNKECEAVQWEARGSWSRCVGREERGLFY